MARATTTPQSLMSVKRFASIWNVASSRMALQGWTSPASVDIFQIPGTGHS